MINDKGSQQSKNLANKEKVTRISLLLKKKTLIKIANMAN